MHAQVMAELGASPRRDLPRPLVPCETPRGWLGGLFLLGLGGLLRRRRR
jgi:MYXO-CTERM domain-containing protein